MKSLVRNYRFSFICFLLLSFFTGLSLSAETPKRIISLAPSLTKNLYLLEAQDLLVGCTKYCRLQSETDAQVIASAIQVNYEKAILLKADLIITTDLTKTKTIDTFKKLGIEVLVFKNPKNFNEICEQFIELGAKIGKTDQAKAIITQARERVSSLTASIPINRSRQKLFMQIGANPLFTVVPGMFMNDLIQLSACTNLASDLRMGSINLESVLLRDPEVIIVVLMGSMGMEEKMKWNKFTNLTAVKKQQIYTLGADNACSPTPLSFVDALEELIGLVYSN